MIYSPEVQMKISKFLSHVNRFLDQDMTQISTQNTLETPHLR